jgi:hypothetical protein
MTGVDDQQPIQTLGPSGPNEPFRNPIGLRDLNRRANNSDALGLKHRVEAAAKLAIMIANQETNRLRALTEGPRNLPSPLRDPVVVRM